jgi:RNA polymerase sigma-70 factor (ECF subfamily)
MQIIQEFDRYRMVFNLCFLDGYSHKEIAEMLEHNRNDQIKFLARARMILKEKLTDIPEKHTPQNE